MISQLNPSRFVRLACLMIATFALLPQQSSAHPISISDAYLQVRKDKLQIRLEVFVEDLYMFHDLKLNDEMMLPLDEVKRGAKLHEKFLQERFKILDKDGKRLPLKFVKRDDDDLPDFDIHMVHLMFFKLVYHYEIDIKEQPDHLTFLQEFIHEKMILPAEVLLRVKPISGPRQEKTLLPNQPWTVRLDAKQDAKADSSTMTPEEKLEYERTQTLGITSYGETYAFLYLEPHETRLEVLIPLATLASSLNLELKPDGILDLKDQEKLKEPILKLFKEQIELSTDGTSHSPVLDRLDFFGVAFRDFSKQAAPKNVSIANARLGIILSYPKPNNGRTGKLAWNLFNQFLYQSNLAIITGEETEKTTLRKIEKQNEYNWDFPPPPNVYLAEEHQKEIASQLRVGFDPDSSPYKYLEWLPILSFPICIILLVIGWRFISKKTDAANRSTLYGAFIIFLYLCLLIGFMDVIHLATYSIIDQSYEPQITETERLPIAETFLSEIYTAFNKREEGAIISQLENVVEGELLRTLYLEISKSMTLEEQGGAIARVGEVKISSCTPVTDPKIISQMKLESASSEIPQEARIRILECGWEVPGSVEHWGHIHQRTTSYLARLAIAPRETGDNGFQWKLIGIDVLNQDQSVIKTSVRKF